MNNVICLTVTGTLISGTEGDHMYLGSERLATDPDDRDLTGAFRLFGLKTAVAPCEWPMPWETVTPAGEINPILGY
jgi:hypothetical protein